MAHAGLHDSQWGLSGAVSARIYFSVPNTGQKNGNGNADVDAQ